MAKKIQHQGLIGVPQPALARRISLPLLILYGLGVTIGAGIYVLIGVSVAGAGIYAPAAFLAAALVMAFTAGSFAELSGRHPQSAGEAIYIEAAFGWPWLTRASGGAIVLAAIVAAAAIAVGCVGYIEQLVALPRSFLLILVIVAMGAAAAYGILESVSFAGFFTVIEILGLLCIIAAGIWTHPELIQRLPEVIPPLSDQEALLAVFSTIFVAFFAFIGFDDVVNLVEEVHDPARTVPIGIVVTLAMVTILYFMVVSVAVLTIPIGELSDTSAPISLMFERLTGLPPFAITMVAVVATMNGIIIQIIMGSRVLYGMARKGRLPEIFAYVHPQTKTPLIATAFITSASLVLALFFPIERLAGLTTQIVLFVFALVNLSLLRMKMRGDAKPADIYTVSPWVAFVGFVSCLGLLIGSVLIG